MAGPSIELLGQELRRIPGDFGPLDGSEVLAVFSRPDAPGRTREGRKSILEMFVQFAAVTTAVSATALFPSVVLSHTQQTGAIIVPLPLAELGARVLISFSGETRGCFLHGYVSPAGQVNCYMVNMTGSTQVIEPGILYVTIWNIGSLAGDALLFESGARILKQAADGVLLKEDA